MSDYKQLSDLKHQYCYTQKHSRFSSFPSRLPVTPGICSKPKYNCYGRIPENKSSLSIHIKPMHSEQIGSGQEVKPLKNEAQTDKSSESDGESENKDLKTILYKMAHPVFHVKEENNVANVKKEPIDNGNSLNQNTTLPKTTTAAAAETATTTLTKRPRKDKIFKPSKRLKINYDNLKDDEPFVF